MPNIFDFIALIAAIYLFIGLIILAWWTSLLEPDKDGFMSAIFALKVMLCWPLYLIQYWIWRRPRK